MRTLPELRMIPTGYFLSILLMCKHYFKMALGLNAVINPSYSGQKRKKIKAS